MYLRYDEFDENNLESNDSGRENLYYKESY